MKKKIAILLAAVMTATMVPATAAFADSSNSINKVVTVKDGDFNDEVFLKIQPAQTVEMGDTIVINIENGEFDFDGIKLEDENGKEYQPSLDDYAYELDGKTYADFEDTYNDFLSLGEAQAFNNALYDSMARVQCVDLPYEIVRSNRNEMEVKLFALPDVYAGETFASVNKPAYKIPVPFVADGEGSVTVTVDANGTSIRGGVSYTIGNSASEDGDTITTVDDVKVGSEWLRLGTVTIKETVYGTFEPGKTVTLKLNSGFEFVEGKKDENNKVIEAKVVPGINADFDEFVISSAAIDENTIEFKMPKVKSGTKPAAIQIKDLCVDAEDDDNFGEIKLTVSGTSAGVTKETILVGERGDYGFTMKAIEDPTTIYAGRKGYDVEKFKTTVLEEGKVKEVDYSYDVVDGLEYDDDKDYGNYISELAAKEYDSDDYVSATVEFAEITNDTWNTNRKLKFTVNEDVKIYDYEIDEEQDVKFKEAIINITNDGRSLEISNPDVDPNEASSFELKLTLSADANYEGDVTLSVDGAGMNADEVEDVVIAKVVKPVTVETSTTKANMGYQQVDTADITITEAEAGMLVKNGTVEIALDSVYGESELGFADEDMDYEIEGDLEISNFKVNKGTISFKVENESVDASKVTIKNVKIGTTRSIPYGSYGLKVGGSAIINNYSEGAVDEGCETGEYGIGYFDTNDAIKFANYIDVVTETGTLDKVVKVTKDEKTIVIDDQTYEMDAAPYIQEESNSMMVPLRFVMIALGVDSDNIGNFDESNHVQFDANTKTATIFYAAGTNMTTIQFTAGSNVMKVNGAEINMENGVKAEIKKEDNRMYVPFRAIGTAINVNVGWDADTRTATYNA